MPRIIYSLHLDCERVPGEPITGFVVPLNREGNSQPGGIHPIGKGRVVDLRVGDWFLHKPSGEKYKIAGISAYRQHQLAEEQVAAGTFRGMGTWWRSEPLALRVRVRRFPFCSVS